MLLNLIWIGMGWILVRGKIGEVDLRVCIDFCGGGYFYLNRDGIE